MKPTIGFIGLGLMGAPMALNLVNAGFPVTVWNRTASKAESLVKQGAKLAANPRWGELATFPNLRFVQSLWAGVDGMLGDPALPLDMTLARLVDPAMAQSMTEGAITAVLYLHRQFPAYLRQQVSHTWRQLPQPVAAHRKVGVLGFGKMGEPVARCLAIMAAAAPVSLDSLNA